MNQGSARHRPFGDFNRFCESGGWSQPAQRVCWWHAPGGEWIRLV